MQTKILITVLILLDLSLLTGAISLYHSTNERISSWGEVLIFLGIIVILIPLFWMLLDKLADWGR